MNTSRRLAKNQDTPTPAPLAPPPVDRWVGDLGRRLDVSDAMHLGLRYN